jgi:hypothetical protein
LILRQRGKRAIATTTALQLLSKVFVFSVYRFVGCVNILVFDFWLLSTAIAWGNWNLFTKDTYNINFVSVKHAWVLLKAEKTNVDTRNECQSKFSTRLHFVDTHIWLYEILENPQKLWHCSKVGLDLRDFLFSQTKWGFLFQLDEVKVLDTVCYYVQTCVEVPMVHVTLIFYVTIKRFHSAASGYP